MLPLALIAISPLSRVLRDMRDIPRIGTTEWLFVDPGRAKLLLSLFDLNGFSWIPGERSSC